MDHGKHYTGKGRRYQKNGREEEALCYECKFR